MRKGNVFVDKEGTDVGKIKIVKRNAVLLEYYMMRAKAKTFGDKFYYVNAQEWQDFYAKVWSPNNPYWKGVDMTLITALQNCQYPQKMLDDVSEFDNLSESKSHGGYAYDGHPTQSYLHNLETWEEWHQRWNLAHINEDDAEPLYNGVWPCFKKIVDILSQELQKAGKNVPTTDKEVVDSYHNQIMKHLNERERINTSKRVGNLICKANYYQREKELEKLEATRGNNHAEQIYSIMIGQKFQFLSIDKQHGMFELCDDNGTHIKEIRFDGSENAGQNPNHGLKCVAEWKSKRKFTNN